jgi:hypothetical protein
MQVRVQRQDEFASATRGGQAFASTNADFALKHTTVFNHGYLLNQNESRRREDQVTFLLLSTQCPLDL